MTAGRATWLLLAGLGAGVSLSGAESTPPAAAPPTAWDVYQVLHTSCVECHGGHLAKPKGKLGYILDLQRLIEEKYITPGDPARSDLYKALVSTDEDEHMPPEDSDGHKPTPEEIETIRAWIAAGALTGEPKPDVDVEVIEPATKAKLKWPIMKFFGRLHPLLVHFPIALLLVAAAAEIASRIQRRRAAWWHGTTRGCLWFAALGGCIAAATGWVNAAHEGFSNGEADTHRWLGVSTAVLAVITLAVCELVERARARDRARGSRTWLLVSLVVSAIVVTLAGHTGGVLAWGADYLPW